MTFREHFLYTRDRKLSDNHTSGVTLNIDLVRKEIPVTSRRAYFDNAGTGPPSIHVLDSIHEYMTDWRDYGENWEEWLPMIIESRRLFGKMIGAGLEEVASLPNVTSALTALASSVKYKPNGNIVISELNFPTNIYIWHIQKKHGRANDVRLLRKDQSGVVPLDEWEKAIDDDTSIVSVDYVSWANGCRGKIREITEIAHEHNAFVIADGGSRSFRDEDVVESLHPSTLLGRC